MSSLAGHKRPRTTLTSEPPPSPPPGTSTSGTKRSKTVPLTAYFSVTNPKPRGGLHKHFSSSSSSASSAPTLSPTAVVLDAEKEDQCIPGDGIKGSIFLKPDPHPVPSAPRDIKPDPSSASAVPAIAVVKPEPDDAPKQKPKALEPASLMSLLDDTPRSFHDSDDDEDDDSGHHIEDKDEGNPLITAEDRLHEIADKLPPTIACPFCAAPVKSTWRKSIEAILDVMLPLLSSREQRELNQSHAGLTSKGRAAFVLKHRNHPGIWHKTTDKRLKIMHVACQEHFRQQALETALANGWPVPPPRLTDTRITSIVPQVTLMLSNPAASAFARAIVLPRLQDLALATDPKSSSASSSQKHRSRARTVVQTDLATASAARVESAGWYGPAGHKIVTDAVMRVLVGPRGDWAAAVAEPLWVPMDGVESEAGVSEIEVEGGADIVHSVVVPAVLAFLVQQDLKGADKNCSKEGEEDDAWAAKVRRTVAESSEYGAVWFP